MTFLDIFKGKTKEVDHELILKLKVTTPTGQAQKHYKLFARALGGVWRRKFIQELINPETILFTFYCSGIKERDKIIRRAAGLTVYMEESLRLPQFRWTIPKPQLEEIRGWIRQTNIEVVS